ncbi:hypothetical protein LP417_34000 (plasmid) [Polaromonas sp. P1-6]|nr:hypothetical protein LP417_34000 [Polaromonas sp. P1-6]
MKYITIIPAVDWFFVHENEHQATFARYTAHHLAAWALMEDGTVVGLLPVVGLPRSPATNAKLIEPPSMKGEYLHASQLQARHKDGFEVR